VKTAWWTRTRSLAKALTLPLLMSLAGNAQLQAPAHAGGQPSEHYRVSVDVNLVVLQAAVLDRQGRAASDLRQQDFEIFEDGVRQTIRLFRHDDIPVTVGLVVDHSGSMRPKIAEVMLAARTFVQSSSPDDEMFVVNFNEYVTLGLHVAIPVSNRPEELARAIGDTPATGKTALYDAIVKAQAQLHTGTRDRKVLLVISDGGDNASRNTLADVVKGIAKSRALVYAVGVFDPTDPDRNPAVLRRLAEPTGGQAFFPRELSEVVEICERIARDIRNQYTLGYVSSNPPGPGAFRVIKVSARAAGKSKLFVRTRSGYLADRESRAVLRDDAK
jgi:Ca-activated chloride channel family protein